MKKTDAKKCHATVPLNSQLGKIQSHNFAFFLHMFLDNHAMLCSNNKKDVNLVTRCSKISSKTFFRHEKNRELKFTRNISFF